MKQSRAIFTQEETEQWLVVNRFYATNHTVFAMEAHAHTELEVMYVARGKCRVFCWDAQGQKKGFALREQQCIVIHRGMRHELQVERDSPCRVLNLEIGLEKKQGFSLKAFGKSTTEDGLLRGLPFWQGKDSTGRIHEIIVALQDELQRTPKEPEAELLIGLLLSQMVVELGRVYQKTQKKQQQGSTLHTRRAMEYVKEYYDQSITADQVAAHVGISTAYLQRLFMQEVGQTLHTTICQLRMEKAKYLLASSTLPIVDVAIGVGYNSRQHFSQIFSKELGCSPGVYRKQRGNRSVFQGFAQPF